MRIYSMLMHRPAPAILLYLLWICRGIAFCQADSYKIEHYELQIRPDFRTKVLSLKATLTIANPSLQDSFSFGLNDRYDSVHVTSPSSPLQTERADGIITIRVGKPASSMTLAFELTGNLGRSNDENRAVMNDSSLFLLWSDRFYPMDFDLWATVRTELLLPAGFRAIAPGRQTKIDSSGSAVRFVFESSVPTVNFSVFADARWIRTERTVNGLPIQTLLYPQSQKFSNQILATSGEVIGFFSSIMCPYPFERFSFVTIDSTYARRAFPGFVGYEPRYLEKEFATTGHDAHETSLLWWGYTSHGTGPGSFQWTEGFGDYAEILYDETYHKPIPKNFERFRADYLALPAEQDVPFAGLRGNTPQKIVHGKYPWLMRVVHYAVGDSAFVKGLRLLFEKFRYRTFSIDEFIATLEEGCGQSLQWWREEWLERKGVPDVAFSTRVEKRSGRYAVTGFVEQRGNIYHIPLEIGIESSSRLKIESVELNNRQETFTFEASDEPTRIVVDPKRWLLMNVTPMQVPK